MRRLFDHSTFIQIQGYVMVNRWERSLLDSIASESIFTLSSRVIVRCLVLWFQANTAVRKPLNYLSKKSIYIHCSARGTLGSFVFSFSLYSRPRPLLLFSHSGGESLTKSEYES
jgi:hypothetical protein